MKNKKDDKAINYKRAERTALIISVVISALILIVFFIVIHNNCSKSNSIKKEKELIIEKANLHNAKFTNYFGRHISARQVNELINLIISNNNEDTDNSEQKKITIIFNSQRKEAKDIVALIDKHKVYTVDVTNDYYTKQDNNELPGYYPSFFIKTIKIEERSDLD